MGVRKTKEFPKFILLILSGLKLFFMNYMEDILIISGLAVIVKTTFLFSEIAGLYTLGAILLLLGIYFAKNPLRR